MFMLLVDFTIKPEFADQFHDHVMQQAANSLREEPGCHFFEVTRLANDPTRFVLSEVYTNAAAFDFHLTTQHFEGFDQQVKDWVIEKRVRSLE